MSEEITGYPEVKRYPWEGNIRWGQKDIVRFLRKQQRQCPRKINEARYWSFEDTINAIYKLTDERGVEAFKGDKVKLLLIAASRERGWLAPAPKPKASPVTKPGEKYCRRCKEVKEVSFFRAVATQAQKEANGWNPDAQYHVLSNLCAPCRANRKRIERQLAERAEQRTLRVAGKRAPALRLFRKSIAMQIDKTRKVFERAHKTLDTPEGIIRYYEFKDVSDQAYYAKKRELLELLRDRLKEHVDNGTLMSCGLDDKPPLGVWHELLLPEERKELAALYWECSWNAPSYKRKTPPLWDMPEGVDPTDKALPDYRSAGEAVPEREIVPEGTVIKPADPDAVENWLAGGSL